MPIMDKEKRNKYFRDYYQKHLDILRAYHRKKAKEYYWQKRTKETEGIKEYVRPKIIQIIKLSKELVDMRDKDFSGFEATFSSSDKRLFKITLEKRKG